MGQQSFVGVPDGFCTGPALVRLAYEPSNSHLLLCALTILMEHIIYTASLNTTVQIGTCCSFAVKWESLGNTNTHEGGRIVWFIVPQHGIDDVQQFVCDGTQRDVKGLAPLRSASLRVEAAGGFCGAGWHAKVRWKLHRIAREQCRRIW
jgi:hypothetical protein